MFKIYIALIVCSVLATASPHHGTFQRLFGGKEDDVAKAVIATEDGYLITGKTKSFTKDRDFDVYTIKIDKQGRKIWSKIYGGEDDEFANAITPMGKEFLIVGSTETYGNERLSLYTIKIDANGDPIWQKAYYSDSDDEYTGNDVVSNGTTALIAATERHLQFFSAKVTPYILKIDRKGEELWRKRYGGDDEDRAKAVALTSDGYIVAGETESYGHGDIDAYLIKLDKNGHKEWHAAFGGRYDDVASDVVVTDEGGYLIVGSTKSFKDFRKDVYIVKTDKDGQRLWQKVYGGNRNDEAFAVCKSGDGGYVVVGRSESFNRRKGFDLYLLKIDKNGRLLWSRTYGGENDDAGYDVIAASDGYLIVGSRRTPRSRDQDVWILKVDKEGRL